MNNESVILITIAFCLWLWWSSRGVAERATGAVKRHCQQLGVVFLNDTVAWQKLRFRRNRLGYLQWQRTYRFEFTSDMTESHQGEVVMLGNDVQKIALDPYRID